MIHPDPPRPTTMMHHVTYSSPLPGAFDVAGKFFREANTPLDTRIRHYFVDSSMCPLLVQVSQ
tara:strand:- start:94 stop:282 length:189 start_codon:yes stop_codon:yes gene_type:complete